MNFYILSWLLTENFIYTVRLVLIGMRMQACSIHARNLSIKERAIKLTPYKAAY
jgi:hypothetical protein